MDSKSLTCPYAKNSFVVTEPSQYWVVALDCGIGLTVFALWCSFLFLEREVGGNSLLLCVLCSSVYNCVLGIAQRKLKLSEGGHARSCRTSAPSLL